jgi:hypothetical protein
VQAGNLRGDRRTLLSDPFTEFDVEGVARNIRRFSGATLRFGR